MVPNSRHTNFLDISGLDEDLVRRIVSHTHASTPDFNEEQDFETLCKVIDYAQRVGKLKKYPDAKAKSAWSVARAVKQLHEKGKFASFSIAEAATYILTDAIRPWPGQPFESAALENVTAELKVKGIIPEKYSTIKDRVRNALHIRQIDLLPPIRPIESALDLVRDETAEEEARRKNFLKMLSIATEYPGSLTDQIFRYYEKLRRMDALPAGATAKKFAKELEVVHYARDIYGPVARMLGLEKLREAIEEEAIRIADPQAYKTIKEYLAGKDLKGVFSNAVVEKITQRLTAVTQYGKYCAIDRGTKSVGSTYRKVRGALRKKEKELEELKKKDPNKIKKPAVHERKIAELEAEVAQRRIDFEAANGKVTPELLEKYVRDAKRFRIIFNSEKYTNDQNMAGQSAPPIANLEETAVRNMLRELKGPLEIVRGQEAVYLASTAKDNGYMGAHIICASDNIRDASGEVIQKGMQFEVHILGLAMHERNTFGKSSHGSYKGLPVGATFSKAAKEIVVRSPKGDLISLPAGSTVVDYACEINTRHAAYMAPKATVISIGDEVPHEVSIGHPLKNGDWVKYSVGSAEASRPSAREFILNSVGTDKTMKAISRQFTRDGIVL